MDKKTAPAPLGFIAFSFDKLVAAQALALKVEQAPAFAFSEQTQLAIQQARESKSLSSVGLACRLAAAELEGQRSLGELAKTLSLAIAAPAGPDEPVALAYPTSGSGLLAVKAPGAVHASAAFASYSEERPSALRWSVFSEQGAAPIAAAMQSRLEELSKAAQEGEALSSDWEEMERRLSDGGAVGYGYISSQESRSIGRIYADGQSRPVRQEPLRRAMRAQAKLMGALTGAQGELPSLFELALEARAREAAPARKSNGSDASRASSFERSAGDACKMARSMLREAESVDTFQRRSSQKALEEAESATQAADFILTEAAKKGVWSLQAQELWARMNDSADSAGFAPGKEEYESLVKKGEPPRGRGYGRGIWGDDGEGGSESPAEKARVWAMATLYALSAPPGSPVVEEAPKALSRAGAELESELHESMHMAFGGRGGFLGNRRDSPDPRDIMMLLKELMRFADRSSRWLDGARLQKQGLAAEAAAGAAPLVSEDTKAFDLEGVGELLALGDQCLLAAAHVARERELAAFERAGLGASVRALKMAEGAGWTKQPTLNELAKEQEKDALISEPDAFRKLMMLYGGMFARGDVQEKLEESVSRCARLGLSQEELSEFVKSAPGANCVELFARAQQKGEWTELDALLSLLAFAQEFREPTPGGHPLSERPMSEGTIETLLKAGSGFYQMSHAGRANDAEAGKARAAASKAHNFCSHLSTQSRGSGLGASAAGLKKMGEQAGVDFWRARSKAAAEQYPKAARWAVGLALKAKSLDEEPRAPSFFAVSRNEMLQSLPYGFTRDRELKALCSSKGLAQEYKLDDEQVAELLKDQGFSGELARAAKHIHGEIPTREGADARSRANAWLAAGKELAKEKMGLSEAGLKAALAEPEIAQKLSVWLGELVSAALAKRARLEAEAAPEGSVDAQRAERLARLLTLAGSRGVSAQAAFAVSESLSLGKPSSGELKITEDYLRAAFSPLKAGASEEQVWAGLQREMRAKSALAERFDAALLERAEALIESKNAKGVSLGVKGAVKALKADLALVEDWAADRPGAFFTDLDPKLRWSTLRRGQERWHEEARHRDAAVGKGWRAALGSWSDASGEWAAEELLTPRELSLEGKAMRHCVGSYSEQCRNGSSRIFSIKKNGVRALTAQFSASKQVSVEGALSHEAAQWSLTQNKGPCNIEPSKEGAAKTRELREALQAAWGVRVEAKATEKLAAALAGIAPSAAPWAEIEGFDASEALDMARWKRARKGAPSAPPPEAPAESGGVKGGKVKGARSK